MKTFNTSSFVFVVLSIAIAGSLAVKDNCDHPCQNGGICGEDGTCLCLPGFGRYDCGVVASECSIESGGWSAWGPCSMSCGLGRRDRVCAETLPSGEIVYNKDTERCKMRDYNCEMISDIDNCVPNPCRNGGRCVNGNDTYTCHCNTLAGYIGNNCEINTYECDSNPCQNGGTCLGTFPGDYNCNCALWFTGRNCEIEIKKDNCDPNPCQNGGICQDGINTHTCNCAPGFRGYNCENDTVEG